MRRRRKTEKEKEENIWGRKINFLRMSIIYEAGMMKRGWQDEMFAENILFVYWFSGHRR